MRTGTTSFGFRYQLLDPALSPPLEAIAAETARLGLARLQICENARPLECRRQDWEAMLESAAAAGVEIGLGCKTLQLEVFERYVRLAASVPNRTLRLVLEEDRGAPPTRAAVEAFLRRAAPVAEAAGLRLAIENHFDIPSKMLAEAAADYPAGLVGFCVDTANSLRNFESPETVLDRLGPRAFCYHLKDYEVVGTPLGFTVGGAKLGKGKLDLDGILRRIFARDPDPEIYLENWAPASGDRGRDIAAEREWLRDSFAEFARRTGGAA
jgi:sugar phosphate isomerase/epimerase